jgi:hypothetical protein
LRVFSCRYKSWLKYLKIEIIKRLAYNFKILIFIKSSIHDLKRFVSVGDMMVWKLASRSLLWNRSPGNEGASLFPHRTPRKVDHFAAKGAVRRVGRPQCIPHPIQRKQLFCTCVTFMFPPGKILKLICYRPPGRFPLQ